MNKGFTINIPPIGKLLLILTGVLIIFSTVGFFVLKASFKSGMERRIENAVYDRAKKDIDKMNAGEHKIQDSLLQVIGRYEDKVRQSEIRDSILSIEQYRSNIRLKKIESGYEKINERYRGITNDSIRRLFAN